MANWKFASATRSPSSSPWILSLLLLLITGCQLWRTQEPTNIYDMHFQSPDIVHRPGPIAPRDDVTPTEKRNLIAEVRVTGNERMAEHQVLRNVGSRPGRPFDPDILKQDIDQLWKMPEIKRVNGPFLEETTEGYIKGDGIAQRKLIRLL